MRTKPLQPLGIALLLAFGVGAAAAQQPAPRPQLTLTTPAFSDGGEIPEKYTCAVKDNVVSPELKWSDVPQGTESFALIVHDLDANPRKERWDVTHWMVWNIPGTATELSSGIKPDPQLPDGMVQGKNIRGVNGYAGPCAPPGKPHHYVLELYALDTKLNLPPTASRADLMEAMNGHIIGKAAYVGKFHQ